jgi:amino acid adenylation domain-containing protein
MGFLLHHLLSESASRRPEAIAVRFKEETLTYAELEAKSNQFARALIGEGVAPGDRVAIHLEKSLAAVVSVFGVLKAGACYVPIDIHSPGRRLANIVRQAAAKCLVAMKSVNQKLTGESEACSSVKTVFYADGLPPMPLPFAAHSFALSDALNSSSAKAPGRAGTDQDLAYILFTSGSTGEPKGVMLSHLNALTFVNWGHETFNIRPEDCLSNHAPLSFDLSVFDIFVAMKAGATLTLVPESLAPFPSKLSEFIEQQRITVWYSVPSVLTLMLTHGSLGERDLSALRLVLFAGEVFPVKHLRRLMEVLPGARYFNLYGPTETNVCTYYEVESIPSEDSNAVPIGKACANAEVIALNSDGQTIDKPGVEGMLYVRGSTVMQGYHGRPRETAETFINNPLSFGREEKLYCTGDWVTLDQNGDYRFVGRKDHMVKTRGYRVDLGGIEVVLHSHPGVHEAVVVAIPDEILGNKLKAFVVAQDSLSLEAQEIKQFCAGHFPRYMVPEEVEFRSSLPRTSNDKIDRNRLRTESIAFVAQNRQ